MHSKEKVLIHKGIDQVKAGEYEDGLNYLDRALEINPESSDALNNRGVALFHLDRIDEALENLDRAIAIDPENVDAMRNMAFILRSQGNLDHALAIYNAVIEKGVELFDLESKAAVLAGLGRMEEAVEVLKQALNISEEERIEEELAMILGLIEARKERDTVSSEKPID